MTILPLLPIPVNPPLPAPALERPPPSRNGRPPQRPLPGTAARLK